MLVQRIFYKLYLNLLLLNPSKQLPDSLIPCKGEINKAMLPDPLAEDPSRDMNIDKYPNIHSKLPEAAAVGNVDEARKKLKASTVFSSPKSTLRPQQQHQVHTE